MLLPYSDDNPRAHIPAITFVSLGFRPDYQEIVNNYGFIPGDFSFFSLINSMFLHGDFMHLAFNMWFLWLYGDNIEDKLGKTPFLGFYVLGGIFASLVHALTASAQTQNIPCIGASGAISAVMGSYIVLFPRVKVKAIFCIVFFGQFSKKG